MRSRCASEEVFLRAPPVAPTHRRRLVAMDRGLSADYHEGLLGDSSTRASAAASRRWKVAAALAGALAVTATFFAANLRSERASLEAQLRQQQGRASPMVVTATLDECTIAGHDIYGARPERPNSARGARLG